MTYDMITDAGQMIQAGKPVILCGWALSDLGKSHYWVVDGIYGYGDTATIRCNWGWGGSGNGWFSASCIDYNKPLTSYSSGPTSGSSQTWANIIMFTYNMTDNIPNKIVPDLSRKRVKY